VTILRTGIDGLYFDYGPAAAHTAGCPRAGTDVWEVTRHQYASYSGDRTEVTIRLACHDCGAVHFERSGHELATENTHASQIGYASKPDRVAGLWLWPGPRIWPGDDRGPASYLITAAKDRPRRPEHVLGRVAWSLGRRGGIRWSAGLGCGPGGGVLTASGQTWTSRRAAVAWVAQHAEPPAPAGAAVPHDCAGGCVAVPGRKCAGGECWRDASPAGGSR